MKLPFSPTLLALLCSVGLFAASGVMYVKSRAPESVSETAPATTAATPPAPVAAPVYSAAQIDQWVAPIALYPDPLLSQILMASTYPSSVIQAAQWSQDNPKMEGDAAIQAVSGQPWDASVKSLVAFPQLMSLLGGNPEWVQNLGDAFLAQPKDVMDAVQRLRALAQQTGALTSTPQQKVTVATTPTSTATVKTASTPSQTVIKIEPADPQVVYVPSYNPSVVYGTWPNASYPPVYLPPSPGQQFTSSFVKGFGYSLGVATTYALFSSIDWDHHDDDHHHHDDDHHDDHHHDGYSHNGDNININVNNYNKITGEHRTDNHMAWQHNPAYRNGVPYTNSQLASHFHQTHVSQGLSATEHQSVNRDSQRQAAMAQVQQSTGKSLTQLRQPATLHGQHPTSSQQLKQISQRNNFRGYDSPPPRMQHRLSQPHTEHKQAARPVEHDSRPLRANALSGNDSRSANWRAQQQRGLESRQRASLNGEQRADLRDQRFERHVEHRELRHR
ncbi:DUF3300 domain-containing protein [Leclercia adecarboxylata]|uniref:DUF3300 domain-containing protein n=1 Tax=Leclercia TaxID=83654 RepID=UPI001BDD60AB|nr:MULTISPECIES: DUF3300 domain-containing protein [Leclercia]MCZ7839508.1 DUF3300 domain-containing protein [Leclercia adecarboxylata]QVV58872.1 DUF3300 domain-containing protein [Leclercia sp. Colony189]